MSCGKMSLSNSIVVKKFGGTSVGSLERIREVAKQIKTSLSQTKNIVVVVSAMSGETNRLIGMVAEMDEQAPNEFKDFIVSSGEQVSSGLLAIALNSLEVKAQPFTGLQLGIQTSGLHSEARIDKINVDKITDCWAKGVIPIVAGFQGMNSENKITTLGRGGSDTSAVAIAAALKASVCEIYTDVDGVYSADPRSIKDARLIKKLDYDSCLELAALGGKVLHHRCVEIAAKYNLPILVKNSFKPNEKENGTYIMNFTEQEAIEAPVVSNVTTVKDVAKVTITGFPNSQGTLSDLFDAIAKQHINVDIIVQNFATDQSSTWFGFSINKNDAVKVHKVVDQFNDEKKLQLKCSIEEGFSKVSVVGLGMRSSHGVASRMFKALEENQVKIHMISTSEIKISCVIDESLSDQAVDGLHQAYFS